MSELQANNVTTTRLKWSFRLSLGAMIGASAVLLLALIPGSPLTDYHLYPSSGGFIVDVLPLLFVIFAVGALIGLLLAGGFGLSGLWGWLVALATALGCIMLGGAIGGILLTGSLAGILVGAGYLPMMLFTETRGSVFTCLACFVVIQLIAIFIRRDVPVTGQDASDQ